MQRIALTLFFFGTVWKCTAQYQWKLQRSSEGIKVFVSDVAGSSFKAVKVECTFTGTYGKLISILTNVPQHNKWIYNCKTSYLLKKVGPLDIIYYSETSMPWPISNRDAVIQLEIDTENLPNHLTISGKGQPKYIPEKQGKARVPHYVANWRVTMPTPQTISITYILQIDPGGIPPGLSNMFVDKGPFETFKNLREMLKK